MKTKIMFFLLLTVTSTVTLAQTDYELRQAMDFFRTHKLATGEWKNVLTQSDIQGSPYLEDKFIDGKVFTTQKEEYVGVPMRYNIYSDQIEFKNADGEVQAIATPEVLEKVEIGKSQMFYIPYMSAKKMKRGYFELVTGGKASLFIRHRVNFKDAEKPGAYKDAVPARFQKEPDDYYIRIRMEAAVMVGNKKDLVDIFPDHQKEIEGFIKKHKTKTKKADSLAELVNYYNTL